MSFKSCLFLILVFVTVVSCTEQSAERESIEKTIKNYYDGYIFRDINKLNKAFDLENGTMKVPITKAKQVIGFKNRYFKEVVPKWGNRAKLTEKTLQNCALEIVAVAVVDNQIANAKIIMKVDSITYVDVLALHKIQGNWKITNKMYTVRKANKTLK